MKICFFLLLTFGLASVFNTCTTKTPGNSQVIKPLYFGQKPPELIPEVFAPGIVSIKGRFEGGVSFSPDLKEIYFGASDEDKKTAIYFSKLKNNTWTSIKSCLLYTSPSPRDLSTSRMPSSA